MKTNKHKGEMNHTPLFHVENESELFEIIDQKTEADTGEAYFILKGQLSHKVITALAEEMHEHEP